MKYAICQELFVDWEWEDQCRVIADAGYAGIEVAPFALAPRITDVTAERRRTLRAQAEGHGLTIIGLHWLLAKTEGLHITSPDEITRRRTAAYLAELARACADMGGHILVFGSPGQRSLAPGMTAETGREYAAEVLRECLPTFDERGVTLCLEPLTTKETNFLTSCAETMQLVRLIDHPRVQLHQDVKAMLHETVSIPELIRQYAPYVKHFHVNDGNLLGPGMGPTDFAPIFSALRASGYDGWVSVEVFDYSPGAEKIARESLAYMRRIVSQLPAR